MENNRKEILMIVQYPEKVSPSQRFRFEIYKDILSRNGFSVTTRSFVDARDYKIIHQYGFIIQKLMAALKGFLHRFLLIFELRKYSFILLQREVAPVGPPVFEWIYIKLFKRRVIFDFDDAIWIPFVSKQNNFGAIFKNAGKFKNICKWSYKISAGNKYLCDYARQYNNNVVYNPTCVDTEHRHNMLADHDVERVTIGWTGSFSTLMYLAIVQPALQLLQAKYDFDIKIICNQPPSLNLRNVKYIKWTEENEVPELASCQIGLMPLANDEWSEGKCGFKLIQYLALGIPAVSSPVGVNKTIIEEGINGYFANTDSDWYNAIEKLLLHSSVRKQMGQAGRNKVVEQYSIQSNEQNFLSLLT